MTGATSRERAAARGREAAARPRAARRMEVHGVVQGVGFRPFVWRLAQRFGIDGWVRNRSGVVEILAEGLPDSLAAFCSALAEEAPPLAHIEDVHCEEIAVAGLAGFEVDTSLDGPAGGRLVSPDIATCPVCLRELFDERDRRYRHPFINCMDCGPRFTIIESLPYDRERTSMRTFPMCDECACEYASPGNRRFHAEPVACPTCGPALTLLDRRGRHVHGDPIERAAARLRAGGIVAVKGLGGFQLACDATNESAVAELRRRKHRPDKPFAVMAPDLAAAQAVADLTPSEAAVLSSWQAPIVIVRDRGTLAPSVAPGHRHQGLMLPSTPLHHLLLQQVGGPLVMTSGNAAEEPICIDNDVARDRLAGIADLFLLHDRDIVARYGDSVVRVWRGEPVFVRRARGVAPSSIDLPARVTPTLGAGALLQSAFCLAAGERAFLSQHLGDLDTEESMGAYHEALNRYRTVFGIAPELVAHDLHPDFPTTRFAETTGLPTIGVQHHHAHVAAVMAEHNLEGHVIGVAFDGFGLGEDGTVWGGEFFIADWASAHRAGHLRRIRQPGGDTAVRDPVRMALAHAADAGVLDAARRLLGNAVDDEKAGVVLGQVATGLGSPETTSAGRLFDAVAALTGVWRGLTSYEAQPAILLEQAADPSATSEYSFDLDIEEDRLVIDTRPIVVAVVRDLVRGRAPAVVAGRFHRTMAAAVLEVVRVLRGQTGLERVCLGGGVFNNDLLVSDLVARIEAVGMEVYLPRRAPAGDGGIGLGQVLVAHARTS